MNRADPNALIGGFIISGNSRKRPLLSATGIAPTNPRESAILRTLPAGAYTAIVRAAGNVPTGIALVEVYQLP